MKIFLDDQWELPDRYPGKDWVCVRCVSDALALLRANKGGVTHLSLDGDLGEQPDELQGPNLTEALAELYFTFGEDCWPTELLQFHSRNPVKITAMRADSKNSQYNPRPWIVR